MLQIKKMRADHVIDFAAEELKEYLRMMMPRCGEISISYEPNATDGFRLGLLSDFGIESEAEDPVLDDVIHVDTTTEGGILAGSNSRSVLFAVYRFLRLNGCRWLYPGPDGDHVPMKDITPQKYHKMADHRFRGHCNEGAEYQQCMLETIDFYAKQELNIYMIEFDNPFAYYKSYFNHKYNATTRPPEMLPYDQVLQWKRQCETEISKRGLMFHDMGHGWTAEPFGLASTEGWTKREVELTEEQKSCVAELNGVRALRGGVALNTNPCMSNPKVRTTMATYIADYAEAASNVDYLHVWLADGSRNHCECEECRKMRPSDYYMMIMNELDEILTARNLDTRIVFICYVDTIFGPEKIKINNPNRFSLLYAPITRSYCSSVADDSVIAPTPEYVRNKWKSPISAEDNLSYLRDWQKMWPGPVFSYEYHFWRHQYADPSNLYIARRIYEDIRSLRFQGVDGYVEDGSQRSFFPNGLAIYTYAETLMDREVKFEDIVEDYFSHIYGEDWKQALAYFEKLADAFEFPYMEGENSADKEQGNYYNPAQAAKLETVRTLAAEGEALAKAHLLMPTRPQTISWRLMLRHCEYIIGVAETMALLAKGDHTASNTYGRAFCEEFGKHEFELERYYDHYLASLCLLRRIDPSKIVIQQEGL